LAPISIASAEPHDPPAPSASAEPPSPSGPSSTPGRILCGTTQCDLARERCCLSGSKGRCVPIPENPEHYACQGEEVERQCDEQQDCPGAQTCCRSWGCSGGCPEVDACASYPCGWGFEELCLPGSDCHGPFECGADGVCSLKHPGVRCGSTRCAGDTPVCCYSSKTRSGHCVAEECPGGDEWDPESWQIRCTSPDDCGGYLCASLVPHPKNLLFCQGPYVVPDRAGAVTCRTLSDCPEMNLLGKPVGCAVARDLPAGTRLCQYPVQ
jgi:hypothetical protein